ncbi:MAG TPA: XdhC family protein [Pyrinomonadaceae bacterium]|nr:XdhC family protein [Pyrinomonadaceae bacterium]
MNELQSILDAYAQARARGERAALATIVSVEGSAYRRPGARMLITESGQTVGTISGGCLERDVAERAAWVMETGAARLIEYDTRGNEDIVWGLGLGCNGVVRVMLESLHEGGPGARALQFIANCLQTRQSGVCATVIAGAADKKSGKDCVVEVDERLLLDAKLNICGPSLADRKLAASIREDALEILAGRRAVVRALETGEGRREIFFDVIMPARPLVIFGAEHDAVPLLRQAKTVGWHVTVVDTRARRATRKRFTEADEILLCRADEVAAQVSLTENTAVVVMTHNYLDDAALLRALLPSPICYLGILGPRQRTLKLLEEINADVFRLAQSEFARLHSPIGLDIGAETPEEVALAIIAEIKAVSATRGGGFLRERNAPIHDEHDSEPASGKISIEPYNPAGESSVPLIICHSS